MAPLDWRTWLATLSPEEKQVVMNLLHISYSSLSQWINTDRKPRPRHLLALIRYNPDLRDSINQEFPHLFRQELEKATALQISCADYDDILQTYEFTADAVCGQTIAQKVFLSMRELFDPEEDGLLMQPSLCVPREDGIITHLHTTDAYGTGVWKRPHVHEYFDLGRDSLAGTAVSRRRAVLYPRTGVLDHRPLTPAADQVKGAGAFPLWRRGNLAGALVIASVHAQFMTEERYKISTRYASLYALSLYDRQFYDPQRIALQVVREGMEQPENCH